MNLRWVLVLVAATALAGCAAAGGSIPSSISPTPTNNSLPPRPRDLPIDRLAPCAILTSAQLTRLGLGKGRPSLSLDGDELPACQWARFPEEPQDLFLIAIDLRKGAEYALASPLARVVTVTGFAAVESQRSDALPTSHCLLAVDLAAGQNLAIRYDYDGVTIPMTKELACDKAKVAAEMAIQTLIEQAGG